MVFVGLSLEKAHFAHQIPLGGLQIFEGALAYAIGVPEPVSVMVDAEGTGKVPDEVLCTLVRKHFELTPAGILTALDLRRPIYKQTAVYGHFGRTERDFTWERIDRAEVLAREAGRFGA